MPGEWGGTAAAYAASFALLCAGTVDAMLDELGAPPPGGLLLDVGAGPGTLARAAAARGWDVEASDPEPDMLELAAENPAVRIRHASLPALPHPDGAADAVAANFVVNHLARPREGLAELVRVARGRVAVTIWPRRRTELNGLWSGVVADAGATTAPGTHVDPADDIERSEEGLAAALAAAGLPAPRVRTLAWDFAIAPEALWGGVEGGAGTIGTTYRAQDDAVRSRMAAAYRERAAALTGTDGLLHLPTFALLGSGVRR